MQLGDRIELNERAQNVAADKKKILEIAYTAFHHATWLITTARKELFAAMEEIYPELEEWQFTVIHDQKSIVVTGRKRKDWNHAL